MTVSLNNIQSRYTISNDSIFVGQKFALYLGLRFPQDNEEFYIKKGIFVITNANITSNMSQCLFDLNANDKFSLYNSDLGSSLQGLSYVFASTRTVRSVLEDIMLFNNEPKKLILSNAYEGVTLGIDVVLDIGSFWGDALIALAKNLSASVYFDENGNLCFLPTMSLISDANQGSSYDYGFNKNTYLGGVLQTDFTKYFNSIQIYATNASGNISITSTAKNTNLLSPTNIYKIKERFSKAILNDLCSSQKDCDDQAVLELALITIGQLSVSLKSTPIYHYQAGDIVTNNDPKLGLDISTRLFIQTLTHDMKIGGQSTCTAVNITELPI